MGIPVGMLVVLAAAVIVVGAIIAIAVVSARKERVSVAAGAGSYFDGNTWQLIGYRILSALVNTITLGIAYPWMLCMVQRWKVKHTVIHGRRLKFNGHGHQLIGKYLLWVFLTIITFGIYGIWLGLGMKKWVIKHTVYADEERPVDSYFSGGAGGYLGIHILSFILTLFTFGIGKAWADKMVLKWEAKHTHIGGSPLEFNGTGGQLFVKYLLLVLLTPLTLGIYALFFTVIYMKWEVKHTEAVYQTPEIQTKAKAHELTTVQDFAKYRIAANDQEIAAIKSGYTGKEDVATLEQMAAAGNPFAAYHLAKQLKGENALYEDKALGLLQKAADGKVHSALLDLAKQSPTEQKVSILTEAAQCGNAEASWLLVAEYKNANNLPQAAYWFKVAMEWGVAEATARTAEYDEIVKDIALQLSESRVMPRKSKVLPIVLGVIGGLIVAGIIFGVLLVRVVPSNGFRTVRIYSNSMAPTLESGDVIYLDDDVSDIEVGDIIAYIYDETGAIAAHRVVEVITDDDGGIWYITKGDNNSIPDADPVHPSNIIGVYEKKAGFFGRIFGLFSSNSSGGTKANIPVQNLEMETTISTNGATDGTDAPSDDNTVETTSPTESIEKPSTPTEPSSNFDTTLLVGDWVGWNGSFENAGGRDLVPCVHMSFSSDGTFSAYEMKYVIMDDGSYMESTTRHTYGGDYRIDGDTLILHYTYFNSGNPDERDREATTTHKIAITDNKMQINNLGYYDAQYNELYKGVSAKDVVGRNPSQETVSSADIIGVWVQYISETGTYQDYMTGASYTSDGIRRIMWEFSVDGTYTYSSYFFVESDDGSGELYYDGKYWTDKDIFGIDGTYSVSGSTLITVSGSFGMEFPGSTSEYPIQLTNDGLLIDGKLFVSDN